MLLKRKLFIVTAALLGAVVFMAACAPVTLLNTITPSSSFSKDKNVSYGTLSRQKLDIYRTDTAQEKAAIIVFTHGGSWTEGSKDIYKFLAEGFTSEGYTVAVPNYRLYPDGKFPDMIIDTANAIGFIAKQFPGRPIIAMGHSAGGYNTLMALLDKRFSQSGGVDSCQHVAGVVSLASPTGAYALKKEPFITIFPDRFRGDDAPLAHVNHPSPPLFLMNGAGDTTVGPKNARALGAAVIARGGRAELKIYDGLDHTDAVKHLSRHFDGDSTLKADIITFADKAAEQTAPYCQ